jgi:hypothetical protein
VGEFGSSTWEQEKHKNFSRYLILSDLADRREISKKKIGEFRPIEKTLGLRARCTYPDAMQTGLADSADQAEIGERGDTSIRRQQSILFK